MVTKQGVYINIQSIDFIRVIHDLAPGYQVDAYPKYAGFIKDKYIPLELVEYNSLLICLSNLRTMTFTTPKETYISYPANTKMTVHINKDNIAFVNLTDEFESVYTVKFISGAILYTYDKDTIKKISSHNI